MCVVQSPAGMASPPVVLPFKFAVAALAFAFPHTFTTASTSSRFLFRFDSAFSTTPKSVACDLLSVLGSREDASRVDPSISKEIRSCLKFLVPFSPNPPGTIKLAGDGDAMVWWPPHSVIEMARIAVDSGGDPADLQRLLDPTVLQIPDVEGLKKDKCQLTRTPYGRRFVSKEINSYLAFLFGMIVSRGPSVGLNVSLSRYDLFHGHMFLSTNSGRLGILFHAKEYPVYENETLSESESDAELDIFDLPDVPKVQPTHDASVDSETHNSVNFCPGPPFEMPQDLPVRQSLDETSKSTIAGVPHHDPSLEYNVLKPSEDIPPTVSPHTVSSSITIPQDAKQNLPFVSSSPPHITPSMNESAETASNDQTKSGVLGDLDDIMKAARTAADSADRAAAAARAAALLAEVRISEFDVKKNVHDSKNGSEVEKEISNHPLENSMAALSPKMSKPETESLNTWDHMQQPSRSSSLDDTLSPRTPKAEPSFNNWDHTQQPLRSASLDDDPYFSYPNLFSRQNSHLSPDGGK